MRTYLILTKFGISFWLALLPMFAGILVLSLLVGWICFKFRLREFYFAVVTLAFSELARLVVLNWNSVTNGTLGLLVLDKPTVWLPGTGVVKIEGTLAWYLLTLTSLCAVTVLSQVLVRSWIGRNFAAIRLNEDLAQTLGINTFRYKLLAFTVSNILAAFAGVLFGFYTNYIEPSQLSITQSLDAIAMVLLGGMGSILGPVVGAFLLTGLPHVIEFSAELRAAAYGAILILAILVMPRGIVGLVLALAPCFLRSTPSPSASAASLPCPTSRCRSRRARSSASSDRTDRERPRSSICWPGLLVPDVGKVVWQGRDISGAKPETIAAAGPRQDVPEPAAFRGVDRPRARHDRQPSRAQAVAGLRPLQDLLRVQGADGELQARAERVMKLCRLMQRRRSQRRPFPTAKRRCSASPWP